MNQTITSPTGSAVSTDTPLAKKTRLYYMDAARSILIMAGVILHTANIYSAHSSWLVHDGDSTLMAYMSGFLHLFRMPAFFIISGFFCAYTLPKYTLTRFLRVRLVRLLVPFAAAALTLNGLQILVSQNVAMEGVRSLAEPLPESFWLSTGWVYHLWFLLNLSVYFLLACAVIALAPVKRALHRFADWLGPRLQPNLFTWVGLILVPACAFECLDVLGYFMPFLHREVLWFTSPMTMLYYGVFFAMGLFLCRFRVLLTLFTTFNIGLVIMTCLVLATMPLILRIGDGILVKAAANFEEALLVVLLCQWVMVAFKTFANRASRVFHYLASASYSIYLFHHLCVVVIGIALIPTELPTLVKFVIVATVTIGLSLAVHHFAILRLPILRFLFNGQYK